LHFVSASQFPNVLPYSRKKLHWEIDCDDYVLKRTNSIWQRGYLVDGLDVQLKKSHPQENEASIWLGQKLACRRPMARHFEKLRQIKAHSNLEN
jgi:hypothetical protein